MTGPNWEKQLPRPRHVPDLSDGGARQRIASVAGGGGDMHVPLRQLVHEEREDQHAHRADALRPVAGSDRADGLAPVPEADWGVPGRTVRHAARQVKQVQSDEDAQPVGGSEGVGQVGAGVSAEAARHSERDGGAGADAEGPVGVFEAAAALFEEPKWGLLVFEHLRTNTR